MKGLLAKKQTFIIESEIIFIKSPCFPFTHFCKDKGMFNFERIIFKKGKEDIDDFLLWMKEYQNSLNVYFSAFSESAKREMLKSQNIRNLKDISSLTGSSLQRSPTISNSSEDQIVVKKSFKEIFLLWFMDTHVSDEPIFSRSTEITLRSKNNHVGGSISHVDRNYQNYRSYNILADYFSDPVFLDRLIFSHDILKPPNINLEHYFYLFFVNITVNCFSYDNIEKNEETKISETILMQMIYLLETKYSFRWWVYPDEDYPESTRDFFKFIQRMHTKVQDHDTSIVCKRIFEIIFQDVCKKCFFRTSEFIISYFLKSQIDSEEGGEFQRFVIDDDFLNLPKFRGSIFLKSGNGDECFLDLFYYLLESIDMNSSMFSIIIMRNLQNMFLNHQKTDHAKKNRKQKSFQDIQEEMKKESEQKIFLTLKNEEFWQKNATKVQPSNIIQTILFLKENNLKTNFNLIQNQEMKPHIQHLIVYLLNSFWNFSKSKSSLKLMETVMNYTSSMLVNLIEKINFIKTDENAFFTKIFSFSIQNERFKEFLGQIITYFDRTSERKLDNLNLEILIKMDNMFQKKATNQKITMLHEMIFYLLIWYLYLTHNQTMMGQDKFYSVVMECVIARRKFIINRNQMENQSVVRHGLVGEFSTTEKKEFFKLTNIFANYNPQDLKDAFNEIGVFLQYALLISHHYNWKNVGESLNIHFLNLIHNQESFVIDSQSYNDLKENHSTDQVFTDIQIDIIRIDQLINLIFCFEKFFVEKHKSCGKVYISLNQLYEAAEKCRMHLTKAKYSEMIPLISQTPESKQIQLLVSFLKMKIVSIFQHAQSGSNYPEDAFMMLLIKEKRKTVQLLMSAMNVILSIYIRIKMASSVSEQFVPEHSTIPKNFVLNPLKYAISDALSDHAHWIRMMQKTITSNKELLSFAWMALPGEIGRRFLTDSNIRSLRFDLKLFSRKTNPTNYLDWRMWFATLPHLITQNYDPKSLSKPVAGKVYCLVEMFISKPVDPFLNEAGSSSG